MKALVRVMTQYWENYGDAKSPHWKPKGGQEFTVLVEIDVLMYAEKEFVSAIEEILDEHHTNHQCRHTYASHSVLFHQPIAIDQAIFDKAIDEYTRPGPIEDSIDPETRMFRCMQEGAES